MKSPDRAAAIAAALTVIEQDADDRGWNARPTLFGLFDIAPHRHAPWIGVRELPVDEGVWQLHEHIVPGLRLPYWVGLKAITKHLTLPHTVTALRRWACGDSGALIGMAFLCEGGDTDAASTVHPDGVPVRVLIGCDSDDRQYQVLRVRGAASTTTTVLDSPPAAVRDTVVPQCLRRLLSCARA
ncbi:hypothetical protein MRQ36_28015 [Micromonospora sp. R77]|uniref:hypothetical protein n=1 Tax=Micromonospora sp. R77 TaxID=2925836 RepID=UPI001F618F91|nr:hypothetical protein [Micromonospora sp. R77]MCI4066188.1 hypothetical protein [Micromonospora sp. R77]